MKFQMRENSLFAILLRKPWYISIVIAVVIGLVARALLPDTQALYGAFAGLPFLAIGVVAAVRQWRQPTPARIADTLQKLSAMPWTEFADALERGLKRDGYGVQRRGAGNDADFELTKAGRIGLLGCKRWKAARLGVEALRPLQAAGHKAGASELLYVGVGEVTASARSYANEHGIRLLQAEELARIVGRLADPSAALSTSRRP